MIPRPKIGETPPWIDLVDTKIRRGGETSNESKTVENSELSCRVGSCGKKNVEFSFKIPSKGGGRTVIEMQIGILDLANIVRSVAERMPEIGTTLSESVALASKRNITLLEEARAELQKLGATNPLPSDEII
jgi:hypothetical protein